MPLFKLYLHFQEAGHADFTHIVKLDSNEPTLVGELIQSFVAAHSIRHPTSPRLNASTLQVLSEKRKPIEPTAQVTQVFKAGSDAFVVTVKAKSRAEIPRPASTQSASSIVPERSTVHSCFPRQEQDVQAQTSGAQGSSSSRNPEAAFVKPFLERAADAEAKHHYRIAATIYEQVLEVSPHNEECLVRLISLWRKVSRPQKALVLARRAVEHFPQHALLRQQFAACLWETGALEDALREYDATIILSRDCKDSGVKVEDAQAAIVEVLYKMGDSFREAAAKVVMDILQREEGHPGALFQYAAIAQDRGLVEDAVRVLLRMLVLDPDNAKVKLLLSQCLQQEEGMQLVRSELMNSPGSHAALAFLATAVKDHGALATCIQLFEMALQGAPSSPSYALNLMHALELQQDYARAVHVAIDFCAATRLRLGGGVSFAAVGEAMKGLPQISSGLPIEWLRLEPWRPARCTFPTQADQACALLEGMSLDAADYVPRRAEPDAPAPADAQVDYTPEELDALALLFTTVKVLFLGGALCRAARLVALIEPARRASRKRLHTTLIRNEAAYFGCVAQLLQDFPPPPMPAQPKPLYLCGDSHTLSGAWHMVELRGEPRLLTPLLVTGCKIWHLRPAGRFYPKMAWLNSVNSLPQGAQVIFMFGEIDCREGLLLAVDKLKYESMEEARGVLIDIYAAVLLDLVQRRGFEVFVHPVPSVLNETRHVVRPFNLALKAKILEVAATAGAAGKMHWLDFFDQLLTPDGLRMRPELEFDGTHMNPGYVQIMQTALASF